MPDFYVMDKTRQQVRQWLQFKGDIKSLSVDCNSWADDNGAVTTATWSVENSGQASISGQTLVDNVASALITTTEAGWSMLKLVVTDGTHTEAIYIKCRAKDPQTYTSDDYGMYNYG